MENEKKLELVESPLFGSSTGTSYEEIKEPPIPVIGFTIWVTNDYITAIQTGDVKGLKKGGSGGQKKNFKLLKDEEFIQINVRAGTYVDGIQFVTNKKTHEWFGSQKGEEVSFEVKGTLVGVKGSTQYNKLDSIQFLVLESDKGVKDLIQLGQELQTAFNIKNFSDVKLIVNGEELYAHSLILAQSPKLKELTENKKEITLKVASLPHFKQMIEYLYSGLFYYQDDNYMEMLNLANEFDVKELKLAGFDYVIKGKCNAENVCKLLMDSKKGVFATLDPDDLVKRCMTFIAENTEEVLQSKDFIHLDHDFILSMIKSDDLQADETTIFRAVYGWGKNQKKTRKDEPMEKILADLIPHVRYVNMDGQDLVHYVKPTGLIDKTLYLRILESQTAPEDYKLDPLPEEKQRGGAFKGCKLLTPAEQIQLQKWIGKKKGTWKLVYKATRDGFDANKFRALCTKKSESVTIIQSEKGYTFGGYTPIPWAVSNNYTWDNKSFLFSFKNPNKKAPVKIPNTGPHNSNQYSTYQGANYGPTFGGGHDIYICSNSNTTNSSYTNLGHSYALPGYTYGQTNTQSYLAGSYNFKTTEIEVYYL